MRLPGWMVRLWKWGRLVVRIRRVLDPMVPCAECGSVMVLHHPSVHTFHVERPWEAGRQVREEVHLCRWCLQKYPHLVKLSGRP